MATGTQTDSIESEPCVVEALPEAHVTGSTHSELVAMVLGKVSIFMGKRHGADGKQDRKSDGELGKDSHCGRERGWTFERSDSTKMKDESGEMKVL